jgi:hypothetical protein
VAAFLFLEALLEFLHELVPAQLFELGLFFGAEVLVHHRLQPFFGQVDLQPGNRLDALEVFAEGLIESVEVAFVLDEAGAGKEVEILHAVPARPAWTASSRVRNSFVETGSLRALRWRKKSMSMGLPA